MTKEYSPLQTVLSNLPPTKLAEFYHKSGQYVLARVTATKAMDDIIHLKPAKIKDFIERYDIRSEVDEKLVAHFNGILDGSDAFYDNAIDFAEALLGDKEKERAYSSYFKSLMRKGKIDEAKSILNRYELSDEHIKEGGILGFQHCVYIDDFENATAISESYGLSEEDKSKAFVSILESVVHCSDRDKLFADYGRYGLKDDDITTAVIQYLGKLFLEGDIESASEIITAYNPPECLVRKKAESVYYEMDLESDPLSALELAESLDLPEEDRIEAAEKSVSRYLHFGKFDNALELSARYNMPCHDEIEYVKKTMGRNPHQPSEEEKMLDLFLTCLSPNVSAKYHLNNGETHLAKDKAIEYAKGFILENPDLIIDTVSEFIEDYGIGKEIEGIFTDCIKKKIEEKHYRHAYVLAKNFMGDDIKKITSEAYFKELMSNGELDGAKSIVEKGYLSKDALKEGGKIGFARFAQKDDYKTCSEISAFYGLTDEDISEALTSALNHMFEFGYNPGKLIDHYSGHGLSAKQIDDSAFESLKKVLSHGNMIRASQILKKCPLSDDLVHKAASDAFGKVDMNYKSGPALEMVDSFGLSEESKNLAAVNNILQYISSGQVKDALIIAEKYAPYVVPALEKINNTINVKADN